MAVAARCETSVEWNMKREHEDENDEYTHKIVLLRQIGVLQVTN